MVCRGIRMDDLPLRSSVRGMKTCTTTERHRTTPMKNFSVTMDLCTDLGRPNTSEIGSGLPGASGAQTVEMRLSLPNDSSIYDAGTVWIYRRLA